MFLTKYQATQYPLSSLFVLQTLKQAHVLLIFSIVGLTSTVLKILSVLKHATCLY